MTDLKELYYAVKKNIDKVDFSKLWAYFKPLKFALYNDNSCFYNGEYIEKTDDFVGNTAINFKGEIIAIWNIFEDTDPLILASKIVHEMFHGFQLLNNESRFPNELDALYNYKYDNDNLSLKLEENNLIVELLNEFNIDKFNQFKKIRKFRSIHFKYEYHYECMIEQIEGSANFVELNALKQLDNDIYLDKLKSLKESILIDGNLLPIRIISYDIGALLLILLNENNISYNLEFNDITFSESIISNTELEEIKPLKNLQNIIDRYYKNADKIITETILKNDIVISKPCDIICVNVYNAIYYKNYIITRYFVMINDGKENIIKYGDFLVETLIPNKTSKIYKI